MVAAFAVAISAASIALVGVQTPALATEPADWSKTVNPDNPDNPQIFSAADGSVTVTACNHTYGSVGSTTYASNGTVQSTIPTTTAYGSYSMSALGYCGNTAAVGTDGTLYGNDETSLPGPEKVAAYSAGTELWSHQLVTTDCPSMQGTIRPYNIKVGADGNVYVAGRAEDDWCGHRHYLASLSTTGTLRWQIQLSGNAQQVAPYSTGLAVMDSHNQTIRFFDYDGNVVASQWVTEPTSGGIGTMSVSTSGVVSLAVQGNPGASPCNVWQTSYIVAYGPSGEVFNQPQDACWTAMQSAMLSNGDVAFIQTHYPDRERHLVILSPTGSVVSQQSLETSDGVRQFSLDIYNSQDMVADTNGNLLLMRGYSYTYSGQTQYGMQFDLVDPATGAFLAVFNTDTVDTSPKLAYRGVALVSGKLYLLVVDCTSNNCSSTGDTKLYAVRMAKLGMDYPRGSLLGVQSNPIGAMAVAGDSFSSGVGSLLSGQSYEEGTNTGSDYCQRSPNAYGHVLNDDLSVRLDLTTFLACAGAKTSDLTATYQTEPPQIGQIPTDVKSVFLTIGGNDADFAGLGARCVLLDCSTPAYQQEWLGKLPAVQTALQGVYQAVLNRAPNATVYVLGYPHILPLEDCSPVNGWWLLLAGLMANSAGHQPEAIAAVFALAKSQGLTDDEATLATQMSGPSINVNEAIFANTFENKLNLAISDARDAVGSSRLVFVSATQPGSPFEGHALCDSDEYFNGLSNDSSTFHPNAKGQSAYEKIARDALAAHQSQYVLAG